MSFLAIPFVEWKDGIGAIVLWDMYVGGMWHGSRRTIEQVNEYRRQL